MIYSFLMIFSFICIFLIASIICFPKIKVAKRYINTYWIISLIGAMLMMFFNCVSFKNVFEGLFSDSTLNPFKILVLFFSMTFLSVFLDEVGFFKYIAAMLINKTKSNRF